MKIAVTDKNASKIEAALAEVNGKAVEHCFTEYAEIHAIACMAEHSLIAASISKTDRPGAMFRALSSSHVAKCYKYTRRGTRITLMRGAKGWFLIDATGVDLYPNQGGLRCLMLTAEQDAIAVAQLRKTYGVIL